MNDLNGCVFLELVSIQVIVVQLVLLNRNVTCVIHPLQNLLDLDEEGNLSLHLIEFRHH